MAAVSFGFGVPFACADSSSEDLTKLSIEELMNIRVATVYGASKFEQKISEAPSAVTIITADDIKKYGYRTLADILRSVRSFQITNDRNYSYIGVRGFGRTGDYNSRILVLVDGHRINDNIYDSVLVGTEFIIDVDLIERVEVIRGPGSSLYGNNAFLAVINVITRRAETFGGIESSASAGSLRTYTGRVSYGKTFGSDAYTVLSASAMDSKGHHDLFYKEYDSPLTNNGVAVNADFDRDHSFFAKLGNREFTAESAYVSRTKGIPTGSFGTDFNDSRNRTLDERAYVYLKYEHAFENESRLMGRIFYDTYNYRGTYIYSGLVTKDFVKGQWAGAEAMFTGKLSDVHKITGGAEYQINMNQDQGNYDEFPYHTNLEDRRRSRNWALYGQDEFGILKNLILNFGVRHDHYYSFGGSTNPRAALIYTPEESTALKLLYGRAFRAPNNYELYYADNLTAEQNTTLKPETIRTYEFVIEHFFGDHIKGTGALFYNRIKNLIAQQTDANTGLLVFRNTDNVNAKGAEFEIEGIWEGGYKARASYTYQDARNADTQEVPVNSPRHLVKFNMTLPLWSDRLFAGIEEQFSSRRKTLNGSMTDYVYITNVTLFSQRIVKNLEFSGSIYNLFNRKYGDPGAEEHLQDIIEQDGRAYRVKLTYTF